MNFLRKNPRVIKIVTIMLLLFMGVSFGLVTNAAVDLDGALKDAGKGIYGDETLPDGNTLVVIIGKVIRVLLSFIGVILVMIIIYAGFMWMTAGGNEDQVKKAKEWLKNAIVGLVISLSAYAISAFVVSKFGGAVLGS